MKTYAEGWQLQKIHDSGTNLGLGVRAYILLYIAVCFRPKQALRTITLSCLISLCAC